MKCYRGKGHYVKYLGIVNGEEFERLYNEMSNSSDKLPVASTLLMNTDDSAQAWIFYETKTEEVKEKKGLIIDL